jgi:hypothetical protein
MYVYINQGLHEIGKNRQFNKFKYTNTDQTHISTFFLSSHKDILQVIEMSPIY